MLAGFQAMRGMLHSPESLNEAADQTHGEIYGWGGGQQFSTHVLTAHIILTTQQMMNIRLVTMNTFSTYFICLLLSVPCLTHLLACYAP